MAKEKNSTVKATVTGIMKNLETMSYKDLQAISERLDAMMGERAESQKQALQAEVSQLVEQHGFSVEELFGTKKRQRRPAAAKYRNPDDPEQTWTGRGRKPRWMAALLAKGKKKEDFRI